MFDRARSARSGLIPYPGRRASSWGSPGGVRHREVECPPPRRDGIRPDSGRIRDTAPQWPGPTAYLDRDLAATVGNGVSQRALPSGEELVPAARNGWL